MFNFKSNQYLFNPFESTQIINEDHDPDANFYNESVKLNASYYDINTINSSLELFFRDAQSTKSTCFSAYHQNMQSINNKIDTLKDFLHQVNHRFSIICLTESWMKNEICNSNSNLQIPGYSGLCFERKSGKSRGGICTYIREDISYKCRTDLSASDADFENFFIELINPNGKNMIVCTTYRQPNGNLKNFMEEVTLCFTILAKENKKVTIVGDFNVDCLKFDDDKNVEDFYNHYFNFGLIPIVNRPTRITQNSCTAIDNTLINYITGMEFMSGILKTDISDHFPIFVIMKDFSISNDKTKLIRKRIFSQEKVHLFTLELSRIKWDSVYKQYDMNKSYNSN